MAEEDVEVPEMRRRKTVLRWKVSSQTYRDHWGIKCRNPGCEYQIAEFRNPFLYKRFQAVKHLELEPKAPSHSVTISRLG